MRKPVEVVANPQRRKSRKSARYDATQRSIARSEERPRVSERENLDRKIVHGQRGGARRVAEIVFPPAPNRREEWIIAQHLGAAHALRDAGRMRRIAAADWLDGLSDPLVRENAVLLLRQHEADASEALRFFGDGETIEDEAHETYGGFLAAVSFDRPEDAWPYYAGQRKKQRIGVSEL